MTPLHFFHAIYYRSHKYAQSSVWYATLDSDISK